MCAPMSFTCARHLRACRRGAGALDAGAHVYAEKPFALRTADGGNPLDAAVARGSLVCPGHQLLQ